MFVCQLKRCFSCSTKCAKTLSGWTEASMTTYRCGSASAWERNPCRTRGWNAARRRIMRSSQGVPARPEGSRALATGFVDVEDDGKPAPHRL